MRPNFISLESVKNIACVSQKINQNEKKNSSYITHSKVLKKIGSIRPLGPLGVKNHQISSKALAEGSKNNLVTLSHKKKRLKGEET